MDVRTFSRISKVICDQLLATKAEILQSVKLYFRFACEIPQGKYIIDQDKLFRCFPLCVVRSPPRLFFRLNHLRILRKGYSH